MPSDSKYNGDKLAEVLESRGFKFNLKAGNVKYEATLHKDRPSYERTKAQRTNSDLSSTSTSSASSSSSASKAAH
ncbi:uncharacterized protein DNG_08580 [Cephalotrichum gorgonifer]|uniref:Uncharacterized protein n=1 Tax=Cephalotrichum gorgonifer TaxID=2041049 RepID=A0AAE8N3T6_9PEZI|nr:uncharacterized protein DNG_08580 [Cephalotrichum gorgonifer]